MENLEKYGIQVLDRNEVNKTNGGVFGIDDFLVGVAVAAVVAIITDWDDFKSGFASAFE